MDGEREILAPPQGAETVHRRVIMLAGHNPDRDPRVDWTAASAAANGFDVEVLGLVDWTRQSPLFEEKNGYRIRRFPRVILQSALPSLFATLFATTPLWLKVLVTSLLVLTPVFFLVEVAVRVAMWGWKLLARFFADFLVVKIWRVAGRKVAERISFWLKLYVLDTEREYFKHLLWTSTQLWTALLKEKNKPRLIHCNDLDTLIVGVAAKRFFGTRVVYDAHEYWLHADDSASWLRRRFIRLYERFLTKQVDEIVTVNPYLAKLLSQDYKRSVHSVANCVPWTDPGAVVPRERTPGVVRFLFQGNFALHRGIEEVIETWAKLGDSRAILLLRGPHCLLRDDAMELAAALGVLGKTVRFLEPVSEDELVSAAREADVGLVPYKPVSLNHRYACPNKLSQYLHAGLAVLTNELDYVKSIVEKYECGLSYRSSEPETLIRAVRRFLNEPEFLAECRKNALAGSKASFNWQVEGATFTNLYQKHLLPV